jgi:hypothetical protein
VQVTTAGTNRSIVATNSAGTESGVSATFDVDAGIATTAQSTVTASPTNPLAGLTSQISIQLIDQFGNNTAAAAGPITLVITSGPGSLIGSLVDNGGGLWTQDFQTTILPGNSATLTGRINGVNITMTATVNW